MGGLREEGGYISEAQLVSIAQRELDSSLGWTGTRVAEARRQTLNAYFGNSRGDERDGRSAVISRDVFEQVEWAIPQLMEIFTSSDRVVEFEPTGAEDEDGAEQATDACNWTFRKARGFSVLHTAFKDALIQKNGIVKVIWEKSNASVHEHYEGKTFGEVERLLSDPNFEPMSVTPLIMGENGIEPAHPLLFENSDPTHFYYDVVGARMNKTGHVRIDNVPPEEFLINRDARGLYDDTCRFVGHRIRTSESALVAMGFDVDTVKSLPGSQSTYTTDQDSIVRSSQDDSHPLVFSYRHDSERTIYVNELYMRVDMDGDGISEWWKVIVAGEYGQVLLDYEPVEGHPFASGTPIPVPHRFYGLGLADVTLDLQHINTTLWRQFLDDAYLNNDPRYAVLAQGVGEAAIPMANLSQLAHSIPGGYVEEYTQGAIRPLERTSNSADLLAAMEYHDKQLTNRTGVGPESQGIDPNAISKHVFGAMMQSTAAQQRIILYARVFAETLVTDIFKLIFRELCLHQEEPMMIRLRGEWVEMDPASWNHEMDCTIAVGLGHGSRMEKINNLQTMAAVQEKMIAGGFRHLVGEEQVYNTAASLAEALGFKDTMKFVLDPESDEAVRMAQVLSEEQDPTEKAVEAQQQLEIMKLEIERQKVETERFRAMIDAQSKEYEHEEKVTELRLKGAKDVWEYDIQKDAMKYKQAA
jgi:hypothetical protein